MSGVEKSFWQAREEYYNARLIYNMLSNTDAEPVAWHHMQAAWEKLRAAIREMKGGVA